MIFYIAVSFITFLVYAFDKSKAKKGEWRTQESTLHLLGLIGGWPGAALAQEVLRHKSKKTKFRVVFWLTVVVNIIALGWLTSNQGEAALNAFI